MSPVDRTAAVDQLPAELDLLDSWASWRQAREDVQSAYQHWSHCATGHRALAFDMYRFALDREQQAASIHSDRAARIRARCP